MPLNKQAKILTKAQVDAVLGYIARKRNRDRNRVIFLLSIRAGLRAKEISRLTWDMVTDSNGQVGDSIHLQNSASKGKSGRVIPMAKDLKASIQKLSQSLSRARQSPFVVTTERSYSTSSQVIVNLFWVWYQELGFVGCSSHSGRRTFITNAARKISTVGGSLRDVQVLAGHTALQTTQRYIEADASAQKKVVDLV
jgi:integrase